MNTADLFSANAAPRVIALGAFDGVHLAHAAVLKKAVSLAKEQDCVSCAFTFYRDPSLYLDLPQPLINSFSQRERHIADLGIDETVYADFSSIRNISAEEFLSLITQKLTPRAIVCGRDYTFGARKRGDVALLKSCCAENGIALCVIDDVVFDGERISSSRIRALLADGDIKSANRLLGYRFVIEGEVVGGSRLGTQIGFPTANIIPQSGLVLPKFGVYASTVTVGDKRLRAVTNIGMRPTVNADMSRVTVESNLIDFCDDIYGSFISVELIDRVRDEIRFSGIDELAAQIASDRDAVIKAFESINE